MTQNRDPGGTFDRQTTDLTIEMARAADFVASVDHAIDEQIRSRAKIPEHYVQLREKLIAVRTATSDFGDRIRPNGAQRKLALLTALQELRMTLAAYPELPLKDLLEIGQPKKVNE